ncbi:MBL fold metallo-hydrolase [Nocardia thailandica]
MRFPLTRPALARHRALFQPPAAPGAGLTAHFLGVSSLLIRDGRTSVLADGFVTRPGLARVLLGRIAPDRDRVAAAHARLDATDLAAVFCAHSHFDHALDAPVWALQTGADLIGSPSTAAVGRGLDVPESSLRVVAEGTPLTYGEFTLTFVEMPHSHGDRFPGDIAEPVVPPARASAWRTGACYSVLVAHPRGRILVHASANHRPGALAGLRADVVYLGVGALGRRDDAFVADYWREVVTATGARRVVLVHWDDFFVSLDRPLRPLRYPMDDLDRTLARLTVLAGEQGVELQLPVPWVATSPAAFP